MEKSEALRAWEANAQILKASFKHAQEYTKWREQQNREEKKSKDFVVDMDTIKKRKITITIKTQQQRSNGNDSNNSRCRTQLIKNNLR